MRHIISALFLCFSTAGALAQSAKPIELAPDAPDRHVVVRGDTLWGISKKFLKDPYRWPEVWQLNTEEIKNPHRIYPGQVVYLDTSSGQPRLRLGNMVGGGDLKAQPKVYSEDEKREIPAIPQQVIEPFLSEPLIVEEGDLDKAPRIVAAEESHVNAGVTNRIYVKDLKNGPATKLWQIYRPGTVLKDPDTKEVLGHEAVFVGTARFVAEGKEGLTEDVNAGKTKPGDPNNWDLHSIQTSPKFIAGTSEPSTLEVMSTKMEVSRGDSLMPAARPEIMSYVPRAPSTAIAGKIISIYGGVGEAGRYSIVSISKGKWDGVEQGHVLAIYRTGEFVTNRFEVDKPETVKLPDERYGLMFVFRVFDRVSYALVMETARPVVPGDKVQTP